MFKKDLKLNHPINPKFDIENKPLTSVIRITDSIIVPEIDTKLYPSKAWNSDSKLQISTSQWLKKFGLKANNLNSTTLFPKLGFSRLESYNKVLKKSIHSKYGDNLFPKHFREDGLTFNVVAKKERLLQAQHELENAIVLYQQRLDWLSSESRRIFGVIEEGIVTIIIDVKVKSNREFDQFLCAIERLINEQIRHCVQFNFIRVQDLTCQLSPQLLPVTKDSLASAIDWLWQIDINGPTNPSNLIEAFIRTAAVKQNEAIYLITEGTSSDGSREILREKVKQLGIPLNIICYNCNDAELLDYFQSLVSITCGRFHTYSFNMEIDAYEGQPLNLKKPTANLLVKKKVYGGSVGGIGTRPDCVAIFSELEEARVVLEQIKSLIYQIPDKKELFNDESDQAAQVEHDSKEEYMTSLEWLKRYGLQPRKLDFYDVLSGVCFRHCDGVVDVYEPPPEDKIDLMEQQDATVHQKLVNAKYCDKFAHVKWKDGSLVHVQMPADVHRIYSERMNLCLSAISKRIEWLRQGSREIFGTITENSIYILIDTSASMEPHIDFVRQRLYTLMQEQLRHKEKFNFVAFNSKAFPWRDRLVDITEDNLKSAWQWLEGLHCQGSTNTLAALQFSIKDRNCQGIYLLTDGRPDHPPSTILSQIRLQQRLPIHTISFNCADFEANAFLSELAKETGGRFHYFNEISGGADCTNEDELDAWESEDIKLLKAEYRLGYDSLDKVTKLREECHKLGWKKEIEEKKKRKNDRKSMIPGCNDGPNGYRISLSRPQSNSKDNKNRKRIKARRTYQKAHMAEQISYHSFLEALSSRNEREEDWVVNETQEILDRQTERFKKIMHDELKENQVAESSDKNPEKRKCKDLTLKQWLRIYGLVPQHMTILDALAPTIIKVKPKYIPIINRSVISKVLEENFPISHVVTEGSPRKGYKPVVRLVNPLGVDIKGYQEKLEQLLNKYKKKLRQLIKDYIGEQCLEEFDDMLLQTSMGNDNVKSWIMTTFENANWPICEDDLEMFLKEIYIGHKYFTQAAGLLRFKKESSNGLVSTEKNGISEMEVSLPVVKGSKQSSAVGDVNSKVKSKNPKNWKNNKSETS